MVDTRYQLALLGVAKAAYLPSIEGNASGTRTLNSNVTGDITSASAGLNLFYCQSGDWSCQNHDLILSRRSSDLAGGGWRWYFEHHAGFGDRTYS